MKEKKERREAERLRESKPKEQNSKVLAPIPLRDTKRRKTEREPRHNGTPFPFSQAQKNPQLTKSNMTLDILRRLFRIGIIPCCICCFLTCEGICVNAASVAAILSSPFSLSVSSLRLLFPCPIIAHPPPAFSPLFPGLSFGTGIHLPSTVILYCEQTPFHGQV